VPAIERGELWLVESLDDGEDCGVDEANPSVGVTLAKVADANVVFRDKTLDSIRAGKNVVEEGPARFWPPCLMDEVVHFYENRSGNDQLLLRVIDKSATDSVVSISPVQGCVEWSGVDN